MMICPPLAFDATAHDQPGKCSSSFTAARLISICMWAGASIWSGRVTSPLRWLRFRSMPTRAMSVHRTRWCLVAERLRDCREHAGEVDVGAAGDRDDAVFLEQACRLGVPHPAS